MSMSVCEVIQDRFRSIYGRNMSRVAAEGSYKSIKIACAGAQCSKIGQKMGQKMTENDQKSKILTWAEIAQNAEIWQV